MADKDVIEAVLDPKTYEELAPIDPPEPPIPYVEDLTSICVEELLTLARNGSSKEQLRHVIVLNNKKLTKNQINLFWNEWKKQIKDKEPEE